MSLTRFKQGSVAELATLALPLTLTSFSMMLMVVVDRIFLAAYATEAMNAATLASTFGWGLIFPWCTLCGIAEVFVAKHYGAKEEEQIGKPVWQMIWVSLASIFLFVPLALLLPQWLFSSSPYYTLEKDYFEVMLLFAPTCCAYASLAAFWIGRGRVGLIAWVAFISNLVSAGLDYLLIFGVEGWIPEMGIRGAAFSTGFGCLLQVIILFTLFLTPTYRKLYGTAKRSICLNTMRGCFVVGAPLACFVFVEIIGWAVFYAQMEKAGPAYLTIASLSQTLFLLLNPFVEGCAKAVVALVGYLVGEKNPSGIYKVVRSIFYSVLITGATAAFLCIHFSSHYLEWFISRPDFSTTEWIMMEWCMLIIVFYTAFEMLRFALAGVLTATGDTRFQLAIGSVWIWLTVTLPTQILVVEGQLPAWVAFVTWNVYALSLALINLWRFSSGRWKQFFLSEVEQGDAVEAMAST